jgi:phosphoglycerate dehydrogenase-like enzyme
MRFKVALGAPWDRALVERLASHLPEDQIFPNAHLDPDLARTSDVLVPFGMKVSEDLMIGSRLKLIHQFGVGTDSVDAAAARRLGILVANAPSSESGMAHSVAEHAIYLLFCCVRRPSVLQAHLEASRWNWSAPLCRTLRGKTAALIGLGNIGRAVGERLGPMGVRLLAVTRNPEKSGRDVGIDRIVGFDRVGDIVQESDFVVIAAPASEETNQLFDKTMLGRMKPGSAIVNVGRGAIIDEAALLDAIESGRIAAAGLDTLAREPAAIDSPLLHHPRVIVTPHVAGATEEAFDGVGGILAENLRRLAAGSELLTRVHTT